MQSVGTVAPMYNIYRWYRAGWGRYTQADPINLAKTVDGLIEFATAEAVRLRMAYGPNKQHAYAYGATDPARVTDALGLCGTPSCSYYNSKCATAADCTSYYCNTAPSVCPKFGTSQLADRVRQCLQITMLSITVSSIRCQIPVVTAPPLRVVNVRYCTGCITAAHGFCFWSCGNDPTKDPFH